MIDPLHPHSHDPNPEPPSADASFVLRLANGRLQTITLADLEALPQTAVGNIHIVSTGHGISGPFTFHGVTLLDLLKSYMAVDAAPFTVEVVSADGFGNRVYSHELHQPDPAGPILLAIGLNGRSLTRQQGAVRMVVPNEKDDALRQVKWIAQITIKPANS
jgi:DMSO/TMAO reductase YedYZ molybdopterin-dependent catalytic subunit